MTIKIRFFKYVQKTTTCWLWKGATASGYGTILGDGGRSGKMLGAHRASYLIHKGKIPKGMSILHKCDVKICVNPSHLFPGTHVDNMKDSMAKRRHTFGSRNPMAKLNDEKILKMRSLFEKGTHLKTLACSFGITKATVCRVVNRKIWKHI